MNYAKQNRPQFCLFPFNFLLSKLNQSVWVNYAKQTQFAGSSNERKFCFNKGLWKQTPPLSRKNKPNTNPIQSQYKPNTNPICQRVKLMQSVYLQRIMKKNAAKGYEKTKPKQTQSNPISKGTFAQSGQAGLNKLFRCVFFCCVPIGLEVFVV